MKTHVALKMYFTRKHQSVPGFSVRSLARRLAISPSFLSRMLSGQKAIPNRLLEPLAKALDIEPELLQIDGGPPNPRQGRRVAEISPAVDDWTVTGMDTLQVLRNWYYLPILELTTLENYDGTAESVAARLKLSPQTTEVALRELMALGLLKFAEGRYVKAIDKIRFTSAKSIPFIRKFHDEMLEKGQLELRHANSEEEFQRRLITGITVSASPEKVQAAKRRLAECLHEIANDLTAAPGTEVYHLSAQLFPLTKA